MTDAPGASSELTYDRSPPVLVAGTSGTAVAMALRGVEAAGQRVGLSGDLDNAVDRLASQARASAIWIELDRPSGPAFDRLIDDVRAGVAEQRFGAVIATRGELLDDIADVALDSGIEVLIDPTDAERAAALAIAQHGRSGGWSVSDVASDRSSAQLRQLSDEVNRIAATLARLSTGPAATIPTAVIAPAETRDIPPVSPETVRSIIRARRLRARFFPEDLFADPAWDMLLDLLQAELAQLRVPVSSLCIAAAVPATTALRWLKAMVDKGLFLRRADPFDGRRVFVELAPEASQAMHRYFAEVGRTAAMV